MSGARRECGVCWWVYDPNEGDTDGQIAPGTPFDALPEEWRCPRCDGARDGFLALHAAAIAEPHLRVAAIEEAYRAVDQRMRGLPIYNPRLQVEAVGFREIGGAIFGAIVTPWLVCAALVPGTRDECPEDEWGAPREVTLPSGAYEFTVMQLEPVGAFVTCSLMSPVLELRDQSAARALAAVAVGAMLAPPEQRARRTRPPMRGAPGAR